jgi:hypothetical protein
MHIRICMRNYPHRRAYIHVHLQSRLYTRTYACLRKHMCCAWHRCKRMQPQPRTGLRIVTRVRILPRVFAFACAYALQVCIRSAQTSAHASHDRGCVRMCVPACLRACVPVNVPVKGSMYMCACASVHVCMCMCICACVHVRMYVGCYLRKHKPVQVRVFICVALHVCMRACGCPACVHACVRAHHECICVCPYTYRSPVRVCARVRMRASMHSRFPSCGYAKHIHTRIRTRTRKCKW